MRLAQETFREEKRLLVDFQMMADIVASVVGQKISHASQTQIRCAVGLLSGKDDKIQDLNVPKLAVYETEALDIRKCVEDEDHALAL